MKKDFPLNVWSLIAAFLFAFSLSAQNGVEEESGLPGDHFSLEAALELFKKSNSPEDFEKRLNTESNYVNNLDLNEDGKTDYIRVVDHVEGDAHAIVLQVPLSADESQDIAVIEIEKQGPDKAILQIVGDEDVYGEAVIVEPFQEEVDDKGKGPFTEDLTFFRLTVNVYGWKSVRFIYRPAYVVWVSPFRWAYYPNWWRPRRPQPWKWYRNRHVHYRHSYHVVATHRVVKAHKVYTPRRKTSTVVRSRTVVVKNKNGGLKAAKTTTAVGAKRNNGRVVGAKKTSATRINRNKGTATRKTTTTKAAASKKRAAAKKTTTVKRRKKG